LIGLASVTKNTRAVEGYLVELLAAVTFSREP